MNYSEFRLAYEQGKISHGEKLTIITQAGKYRAELLGFYYHAAFSAKITSETHLQGATFAASGVQSIFLEKVYPHKKLSFVFTAYAYAHR